MSGFEEATGVDVPGEGSIIDDAAAEGQANAEANETTAQGEGFGGRGETEKQLREQMRKIDNALVDPAADAVTEAASAGGAAFAMGSPVTADDPQKAANDPNRGDGVGDAVGGATEGGLGALNPARLGVGAIETGEFLKEFAESSPAVQGGRDSPQEFAGDAAAAGALAGERTATAYDRNPDRVAGQLLGGAVVGSAAETAVFRAATRGPDLDSAGSGSSSTPSVDDVFSDSGSSTTSTRNLNDFFSDDRAQLQKPGSRGSDDRSKITASDLRQQPSRGPSVRSDSGGSRGGRSDRPSGSSRGGSRGGRSSGSGSRTGRNRGASARRRRERAQRSEVLQDDGGLDRGIDSALRGIDDALGESSGSLAGASAGALQGGLLEEAQEPFSDARGGADVDTRTQPDVDVGQPERIGPDIITDVVAGPRFDTGSRTDTRTRSDTRTSGSIDFRSESKQNTEGRLNLFGSSSGGRRPRLDIDLGGESDDDDLSAGAFEAFGETFDTGVVQSLGEFDDSGGDLDRFDRLL